MTVYHSKPATVEAWHYDGSPEVRRELLAMLKSDGRADVVSDGGHVALMVRTANGWVELKEGHFLIKGVHDFYPCDPVTFEARWSDTKPMDQRNRDALGALKEWFYNHPERVADLITPDSALGDDYCVVNLALEALKRAEVLRPFILLCQTQPLGGWRWGVQAERTVAADIGIRREFDTKAEALEWLGKAFPGIEVKAEEG